MKKIVIILMCCLTAYVLTAQTGNTLLGNGAGVNLGSGGSLNVIIGFNSGLNSTNPLRSVFIGVDAGRSTTTGSGNNFIGNASGQNNTSGRDNVFMGISSGSLNTTGRDNIFIGSDAGRTNTTGNGNTFLGGEVIEATAEAIFPQFDVLDRRAVGENNGTSSLNTYIGAGAGSANRAANGNTFVGYYAGGNAVEIGESTFVGAYAGFRTDGSIIQPRALRNNYFGFGAGNTNEAGSDNVAIGHDADFQIDGLADLFNMRNVLIGNSAEVEGANDGVLIGFNGAIDGFADNSIGLGSEVNIAGENSTGIGFNADIAAAADNAVGIGHQVDVNGLRATAIGSNTVVSGTNSTAIGYQASVAANNEIFLGNSAIASIGGVVNWTATSDGRFKKNVQENVIGLDFINRLRPVTYNYDAKKLHAQKGFETESLADALAQKEAMRYSGFIAQEVEAAAEQLGYDFSGVDAPQDKEDIYGLRYAEFVVPLVKAVQELSEENETKDQLIAQQAAELAVYKKLLSDLTARVEALEVSENNSKVVAVK
ncbi:MAG: tail fiber domain-containing protein [Bacteroidota bacterium]